MSNQAPFDQHDQDSLRAVERLADVIPICSSLLPCRRSRCKRCRDELAWQSRMERADIEFNENQIWGFE